MLINQYPIHLYQINAQKKHLQKEHTCEPSRFIWETRAFQGKNYLKIRFVLHLFRYLLLKINHLASLSIWNFKICHFLDWNLPPQSSERFTCIKESLIIFQLSKKEIIISDLFPHCQYFLLCFSDRESESEQFC